jgi:mannose-6-phosphate isomerase-like protein (cupin superfamily)
VPTLPTDGTEPETEGYFPPPGGFRAIIYTIAPDMDADIDDPDSEAIEEMQDKLPGILEVMEPDSPGMPTSDTIECTYVISGETTCELDDGETFVLHEGSLNVINGTRHRWTNESDKPVTMMVFPSALIRSSPGPAPGPWSSLWGALTEGVDSLVHQRAGSEYSGDLQLADPHGHLRGRCRRR